jgi:hypothetical protein
VLFVNIRSLHFSKEARKCCAGVVTKAMSVNETAQEEHRNNRKAEETGFRSIKTSESRHGRETGQRLGTHKNTEEAGQPKDGISRKNG